MARSRESLHLACREAFAFWRRLGSLLRPRMLGADLDLLSYCSPVQERPSNSKRRKLGQEDGSHYVFLSSPSFAAKWAPSFRLLGAPPVSGVPLFGKHNVFVHGFSSFPSNCVTISLKRVFPSSVVFSRPLSSSSDDDLQSRNPPGYRDATADRRGFSPSPSPLFTFDGDKFVSTTFRPRIVTERRKLRGPNILRESRSSRLRTAAAARAVYGAKEDTNDSSRPWNRFQPATRDIRQPKKKKRPPPGPRKFEDLTAKTPIRSDLPFDFQYSYTETPKVAPVKYQELFSPFGPGRLDREWDGLAARRKPSSDNILPRKRGAKRVASKNTKNERTREEIIGEPLTKSEEKELIEQCIKTDKQVNIGRDGVTHNMLIVIHHHWKGERAIRIKCKGVSTVDMENVYFQLEDKTGGKIIHRVGGTIYLFRGRNYDYRKRPQIPTMLWRPHSPIYPRLMKKKPDGLTLQEANAMRKRGLKLMPLCKLAKNGFYGDLVKDVREAFEDDELVRINCKDLNLSDYKKIGAKLRELVPCILLSFQREQIIVWRGRDWKSSQADETTEVLVAASEATSFSDIDSSENTADATVLHTSFSLVNSIKQGVESHDVKELDSEISHVNQSVDDTEDTESSEQSSDGYAELEDSKLYDSGSTSTEEVDLRGIFSSEEETDDAELLKQNSSCGYAGSVEGSALYISDSASEEEADLRDFQ